MGISEMPGLPPREAARGTGRSRLSRAALVGLGLGVFLGGGYLLALAARSGLVGVDCGQLSPTECAFEEQLALELSRRQALVGAALMLLALALLLYARAKERA